MLNVPPVLSAACLKNGEPEPYDPCRPCCKERILRAFHLICRHPASVVFDHDSQSVFFVFTDTVISISAAFARTEFSATSRMFRYLRHHGLFVLCQDAVYVVHCQTPIHFIIDHHDRRESAGSHAPARIQRELAVRRALSPSIPSFSIRAL